MLQKRSRLSRALGASALFLVACVGACGAFNVGMKVFMCQGSQAEARANLKMIYTAEHDFHDRFGSYTDNLWTLEIHPEPRRAYAYGFSAGGAASILLPDRPRRTPLARTDIPAGTSAGKDHFRAGAAGHPASRLSELDVWSIDETGQLQNVNDACWWARFHVFGPG